VPVSAPHSTASLNLIRKLGFVQVGTHYHESCGEELIFHRGGEMERPTDGPRSRTRAGRRCQRYATTTKRLVPQLAAREG
jgi:hypothetical protein